jgi:hypothetical protein
LVEVLLLLLLYCLGQLAAVLPASEGTLLCQLLGHLLHQHPLATLLFLLLLSADHRLQQRHYHLSRCLLLLLLVVVGS